MSDLAVLNAESFKYGFLISISVMARITMLNYCLDFMEFVVDLIISYMLARMKSASLDDVLA